MTNGPTGASRSNGVHTRWRDGETMRLAIGDLSTWWVYLIGPVVGATIAVGAYVLRGPPKAQEAAAAQLTPLKRVA